MLRISLIISNTGSQRLSTMLLVIATSASCDASTV